DRGAGAVRVDVVDAADRLAPEALHRHAHATHSTLPRGGHHVEAVGGGAVARDLAVNLGAAASGALHLLEHEHAGAAGDHEAVAALVVSAARLLRRGIECGRHGAHGVE